MPRLALLIVALTNQDYLGRAYETLLWPLLGFLFLPITTLTYAIAMNDLGGTKGWGLVAVVVATMLDLGLLRRRSGPPR